MVAGWFNVLLLSPFQNLVSPPHAAAIQWVKATGIALAFLTAAYIFVESPTGTERETNGGKEEITCFMSCLSGRVSARGTNVFRSYAMTGCE